MREDVAVKKRASRAVKMKICAFSSFHLVTFKIPEFVCGVRVRKSEIAM